MTQHPGQGLILPIDSHPTPINRIDGGLWRPRVSAYDAPFGLEKADSFTLHLNGQASYVRGRPERGADVQRRQVLLERGTADVQREGPEQRVDIRVLDRNGTSMRILVSKRS